MSRKSRQRSGQRKLRFTLPLWLSIAVTAVGLFIGCMAALYTPWANAPVTQAEAIAVSGTLREAVPTYTRRRQGGILYRYQLSGVLLYLNEQEKPLQIPRVITDEALADTLTALPIGTQLDMLLHPVGGSVMALTARDEVILAFEDGMAKLQIEARGSVMLGIPILLLAVYGAWSAVMRWRYRRLQ